MNYYSTRNKKNIIKSSHAILNGISGDGGLFVPCTLDDIQFSVSSFINESYQSIAKKILTAFLTDFSEEQINYAVDKAYCSENFSYENIFPVESFNEFSILELTTGRTLAFKDAALSILSYLIKSAKDITGIKENTLILTATSGDTGKAAMEGFKNTDGNSLLVFYPHKGVSDFQLRQMLSTGAENEMAFAVKGNFDDAQSAVKRIFADVEFNKKLGSHSIRLSSANSINIGRLLPQVVYYYHAYVSLVRKKTIKMGDTINIAVPTGNFGNILAAYYAMLTGLPVNKLICASNKNNVLTDFFNTGVYDAERPFYKTISPSMDILISSNLERLIFALTGSDDSATLNYMNSLKDNNNYKIDKKAIPQCFAAFYAEEENIRRTIFDTFKQFGYLSDPHTAAAIYAYNKYKKATNDATHTLIAATASPYKFASEVMYSLKPDTYISDAINAIEALNSFTSLPTPPQVEKVLATKTDSECIINIDDMQKNIIEFLNNRGI